jgi:hypothetical protein
MDILVLKTASPCDFHARGISNGKSIEGAFFPGHPGPESAPAPATSRWGKNKLLYLQHCTMARGVGIEDSENCGGDQLPESPQRLPSCLPG